MAAPQRTPLKVKLPPLTRSEQMSRVRAKNTRPELVVRKFLHAQGLRFRLHDRRLPGTPDLVFASRNAVVQVRGCFWHCHREASCKLSRRPKSRLEFWIPKLERNRERDTVNDAALTARGWRVFVIWECQLNNDTILQALARDIRAIPRARRPGDP